LDFLRKTTIVALLGLLLLSSSANAVRRFPQPEFESGYQMPSMTRPLERGLWREVADCVVLIVCMALAAWIVLRSRSRGTMVLLTLFSLGYFGFYRRVPVWPIPLIQNVTLAIADPTYMISVAMGVFFLLPLLFALLFGRVFCAAVCPLGALQSLALVRPVTVPDWLHRGLRTLPFIYLGGAVMLAATGTIFIVSTYEPFVMFFRLGGKPTMILAVAIFLVISTVIGRPYCRYLCPYGALLALFSRFARYKATITPDRCTNCSLCQDACPYGAIDKPVPEGVSEE
jgi:polyferredoxin